MGKRTQFPTKQKQGYENGTWQEEKEKNGVIIIIINQKAHDRLVLVIVKVKIWHYNCHC